LLPCLAAAFAGSSSPSTAAAVQGLVEVLSGGFQVASGCSRRRERVQGVSEVVARRVYWACPGRACVRHERRPGRVLDARCPAGVVLELDHGGARVA
jgi:hypothetical protein